MTNKEPNIHHFPNGLRLVYLYDDAMVAHLGVTILGGSRFERPSEEGLAHFLEHCIFKGTEKRKAFHVLSRLDSVGGELNAYTAKEEICIYGSFSPEHLSRAAELLADITFNSVFPEKEIAKEKEIILDEINSYLDSPSDKIFDDFEALIFPNHSLGNNILGTRESVMSFTRQHLLNYVERYFQPKNMVVSFVGDIPEKKVVQIVERYFSVANKSETKHDFFPVSAYKPNRITNTEANYQAHIMLGGIGPGYDDPDRRVMTLMVNMLGGPALNSRLTLSIREKYGYSYSVEANYTPYKETGFWSVYAGTDKKHIKKTIKLIHKELARFIHQPLTRQQLQSAITQLKGHIALGMDSNSGLMLGYGKSLIIFDQIDTLDQVHHALDQITPEDLQRVAEKYFQEEMISELVFDY
jgi:predicted Zn-dependent peptidase